MSEFILIKGLAIIRKDDVREVVPSFEEEYFIKVVPPQRSNEDFSFTVSKEVTVSLEIMRVSGAVKKKGDEEEGMVDPNYVRVIEDTQVLTYDDIVTKLFDNEVELLGKLPASVKNYKLRLGRQEDYMERLASIQSEPNSPDYQNLLMAAHKSAPTGADMDKQTASLKKITDAVTERFYEMVEASEVETESDEEVEVNPILTYFDSGEMQDHIEKTATDMLKSFYNKNMGRGFYDADEDSVEEDDSGDVAQFFKENGLDVDVESDVKRAAEILQADTTIRNDVGDEDEDEESLVDEDHTGVVNPYENVRAN